MLCTRRRPLQLRVNDRAGHRSLQARSVGSIHSGAGQRPRSPAMISASTSMRAHPSLRARLILTVLFNPTFA